jgi:predicted Zn-ribbon and HTH transcriptional regulator
MRVRPQRLTERRAHSERRPHVFGRPADVVEAAPEAPVPDDEHLAERRHRASVTLEDTALYGCSCGYQFQASVTTSVSCPHCGTGQAW